MSSISVGAVRVQHLSDGRFAVPAAHFFPEIDDTRWAPYRAAHLDGEGRVELNFGCFLLEADGQRILVDSGMGPTPPMPVEGRRLPEGLAALGVAPESIDIVLTTHLHFDHYGWHLATGADSARPAFPRARFLMQQSEWEHWMLPLADAPHKDEGDDAALARLAAGLAPALELVSGEHAVTPSVRYLPTPGHTPGHACVLITSGGEGAVILGDVAHAAVQVPEPGWSAAADEDRDLARASRTALWERIEQHGLTVAAGHFPEPNIGRFVQVDGVRGWRGL